MILVTGAASGMGRVATRMFAEQGAKVIAADIAAAALDEHAWRRSMPNLHASILPHRRRRDESRRRCAVGSRPA